MIKMNIIVWQHKFVIGCQEISLACNNFNHDNNNIFLLEGDGHHKNEVVNSVVVYKIN